MVNSLEPDNREWEKLRENSLTLMEEQARSYQIELFEYAKKNNTIVCLGTGTGKTFISVLLVKYLEHEVAGRWKEDPKGRPTGKRTIFLAPKVPLVEQQGAALAQHMTVKVGILVGSVVDHWTDERWDEELEKYGILAMTPAICKQAVYRDVLPLENINLLVLDECHAATGAYDMVEIMKKYKTLAPENRPKILGLTASVINSQVQGHKVMKKIRELEASLFSTAKTASQSVLQFGTKPTEIVVSHLPHDTTVELPVNEEKIALLKNCADFSEFKKKMNTMKKTYSTCGPFCTEVLLNFRERELDKALNSSECAEGFKKHAPIKWEIYQEIREFIGNSPSIDDLPPKMKRLLDIIRPFECTRLSAIVFVKERMMAYVLYQWMTQVAREPEFSFVNCSFIVGRSDSGYGKEADSETLKQNSKAQQKVMKDFRSGIYNLMFATSIIEEGMDVPQCNLIVRFDPPPNVCSYTQSKGRARAKPSLYVILSAENELSKAQDLLESFQETEQLIMVCCASEREKPTEYESQEVLQDDPDLPPYTAKNGRAAITAQSAITLVHSYCQEFMRMKYPNVFPMFEVEETPEGFVCTLTMPIVCPVKEKISNITRPFLNKDKAKMFVALEMCKRLHECGELSHSLQPRRKIFSLHKLPTKVEDLQAEEDLNSRAIIIGPKSREKKRYVLPRKQAEILQIQEENVDCEAQNVFYLYVIKTQVVTWASAEQNWRNDTLFDPSKYPTSIAIVMKAECPQLQKMPKFPIFTRSGEECVSFEYAGQIQLDEQTKQLCSKFNRYCSFIVLKIVDEAIIAAKNFATPCIVPVKETATQGKFELDLEVLRALGPAKLPNFENFVFRDEDYDDAVVELLYRVDETQKQNEDAHTVVPQKTFSRHYVSNTRACDENGELLTPSTTGYFKFDRTMSFSDYGFRRTLRAGPSKLLEAFQPVLAAEHAHERLQMLRPRFANQLETRQRYDDNSTTRYLVPQFVARHAIKASLWRKITSIPTIVYRLNRLLLAEDVRRQISSACRLKPAQENQLWPPMEFERNERNKVEELTGREIEALVKRGDVDFSSSKLVFPRICQPDLKDCLGPSPYDITKALTTKGANEMFDLERLELLGDSFLQIVATFFILDKHADKTISELSVLIQHEVNNRHLLNRAHDKQLSLVLESMPFKATHNFLPFGFRPMKYEEKLLERDYVYLLVEYFGLDYDRTPALKNLRYAKNLQHLVEAFANEDSEWRSNLVKSTTLYPEDLPKRHDIPVRTFQDVKAKTGGDVVEALVGVYLEKCGPIGALRFLKWLGKDFGNTETQNFLDAFKLDFSAAQKVPIDQLSNFIYLIEKVEKQTGYTFKSKGLALQAITHHSCRDHLLTEDYNKLAFVGEAVVDYLLTLYIYNLNSNLGPGQLTEQRSAVINNQVKAHAVVRADLHTVFLYTNNKLFSAIREYLDKTDEIGLRLNSVLGDWETEVAEEAEVPQPLARILLSILGAVFIDSGRNLEKVWEILIHLMGREISLFTTVVPISPISELAKKVPGLKFGKPTYIDSGADEGKYEVKMELTRNEKTEVYAEIAETKKKAKLILAKKYLRLLYREEKLAEVNELKKAQIVDESVVTLSDVLFNAEVADSKYYRKR